jgi:hypothetical protein
MKIELPLEITNNRIYFNPFIFDRKLNNPFKASQRLYPVDFGAPEENTLLFTLELPDKIELKKIFLMRHSHCPPMEVDFY